MADKIVVVFVHGWSVTNTDTYGGLPARLSAEAQALGIDIQLEEIYLGRYISFHDEVRVSDISRAFSTAVEDQLSDILKTQNRFICITHSTGGPVIRDWWHRYYRTDPKNGICPMSHLIMLAPANFGSTLAQLGKSRISRIKSWFAGVEPGQGVLDWLELGSSESWDLNVDWINSSDASQVDPDRVFLFVLTGQSIDRTLYDNLNSYTGELGSDGIVRVAGANLNSTYIKLEQETPKPGKKGEFIANELKVKTIKHAPNTAMRIISGKSHSGKDMGIMRSVKKILNDPKSKETVDAILACIQVQTNDQYMALSDRFVAETETVQENELIEVETHLLKSDTYFIHDRFSMVIFRVHDDKDHPVTDYDLILTAGPEADPNHLPVGFFMDRQRNHVSPEVITYYFNRDIMKGTKAVKSKNGIMLRQGTAGAEMLGFKLIARPNGGFVHYLPCEIKASQEMLETAIHGNSTTLIDICLRRVVRKNVFRLDKLTSPIKPDFKNTKPGDEIVE
jgi:predicted enzyme related to lactoylglutathione lyase